MSETPKSTQGATNKFEEKKKEMPAHVGLPLAAKDSEWIGFRANFDYPADKPTSPAPNLFPGVNFDDKTQSTTVITRQLVGKKADFTLLQSKPAKFIKSNAYSTLPEESSEIDLPLLTTNSEHDHKSCSDMDYDDDVDEDEEPKRAMHVKRRKRRSDMKPVEENSSFSITVTARRRTSSKLVKQRDSSAIEARNAYKAASMLLSYEAEDADMSQSDDTPDCHSSQSALIK